jgi:hypothetical protein
LTGDVESYMLYKEMAQSGSREETDAGWSVGEAETAAAEEE